MTALLGEQHSMPKLLERLVEMQLDLRRVTTEMEAPMLDLCLLLENLRSLERGIHGNQPSKVTDHFVAGLQCHDLFAQRAQNALRVIQDVVSTERRNSAAWIYKATWLGGALVEEARREYVRGFNEISIGLTTVVQAERNGYLPPLSSEIVRPMSVSLANIRNFGKRIREVSNVLQALGTTAFAEVANSGGETDVSGSFNAFLQQYSFADETRTHHLVLNLPPPTEPAMQPGESIVF